MSATIPEPVKNTGIHWLTIRVELLSSDNEYLTYPCQGWLQIQEVSTTGQVTQAAFCPIGQGRGKVGANRPAFRTA